MQGLYLQSRRFHRLIKFDQIDSRNLLNINGLSLHVEIIKMDKNSLKLQYFHEIKSKKKQALNEINIESMQNPSVHKNLTQKLKFRIKTLID